MEKKKRVRRKGKIPQLIQIFQFEMIDLLKPNHWLDEVNGRKTHKRTHTQKPSAKYGKRIYIFSIHVICLWCKNKNVKNSLLFFWLSVLVLREHFNIIKGFFYFSDFLFFFSCVESYKWKTVIGIWCCAESEIEQHPNASYILCRLPRPLLGVCHFVCFVFFFPFSLFRLSFLGENEKMMHTEHATIFETFSRFCRRSILSDM